MNARHQTDGGRDHTTARYLELVESRWARTLEKTAKVLGTSPPTLSAIVRGEIKVSWVTATNARLSLGLPADYFTIPAESTAEDTIQRISDLRFPGGLTSAMKGVRSYYTPIGDPPRPPRKPVAPFNRHR